MPPIDMSLHMTVKECATEAAVTEMTIRRWMDDGCFSWIRKNRRERLAVRGDFNAFMDTLRNPQLQSTT